MPTLENDSAMIPFPAIDTEAALKASYEAVRFNAVKHGILSRHTVLPHEDEAEYRALLAALVEELNRGARRKCTWSWRAACGESGGW